MTPAQMRAVPHPLFALVADFADAERARWVHAMCQAARKADCGYCCAFPGEPCAFSGTGPDGYHAARFRVAAKSGLISAADLAAILDTAVAPADATVIYDKMPGGTP